MNQPSNDTPSVTPCRACQLPQRGSRERPAPSIRVLAKIRGFGRFSSPLRSSEDFGLYHSTNDTPSVSPSVCQLPKRGSRERPAPFIGVLAKIRGYGRFSSPLRNSDDFGLYHSTDDTPSVSPSGCQLPQRGSRERPVPFNFTPVSKRSLWFIYSWIEFIIMH